MMSDEKKKLPYIQGATFTCTHIKGTEGLYLEKSETVANRLAEILAETEDVFEITLRVGEPVHLTTIQKPEAKDDK